MDASQPTLHEVNESCCFRQKLGDRIQEELGVSRVAELRNVTLYAAAKPFGPAVASFLTSLPHGGPDEPVKCAQSALDWSQGVFCRVSFVFGVWAVIG